jgi:hypothetical protein
MKRAFVVVAIGALSAINAQGTTLPYVGIQASFTETVTGGTDVDGLFGPVGADLTGDVVTVAIGWSIDPTYVGFPYIYFPDLIYIASREAPAPIT